MKIVIEKYVCDACGKEVAATERHYMINLGVSNSWNEDAKIDEQFVKKDLCGDCYKTISQLIGEKPVLAEREQTDEAPDGRKQPYDKELVKELYGRGLTYKQIAAKTMLKVHQISYVVSKMTEEERQAVREKYGVHNNDIQEENCTHRMKVTTDSSGMVISVN